MNLQEVIESGGVAEAIEAQNAILKAHPTDIDARYLLSVLLCFAGELDRAFLQLNVIANQDSELGMGSNLYRSLIVAESARRDVFNEKGDPLLPPDAPASAEARLEALKALRRRDTEAAGAALERARASEGPVQAKVNGQLASSVRDYDDFLGPVVEVYAGGNYLWLPIERIRTLEIQTPAQPLDLLWAPASLVDTSGTEASVHLPVLYEGSHLADDARVRGGRMTEWVDREGIGFRGLGQKILLTEQGGESREVGLLEVRSLERAGDSSEAGGG
jgi:type VI secretion system protein ImpE